MQWKRKLLIHEIYEICIKEQILAKNFVFPRMVSSLSEHTKLPSVLKMSHFLYDQDLRDSKPITGPNTPTICDLYGRAFFLPVNRVRSGKWQKY
jgi:hypothetical protein